MSSHTFSPSPTSLGKWVAPDEPVCPRTKKHQGINGMADHDAAKFADKDIIGECYIYSC